MRRKWSLLLALGLLLSLFLVACGGNDDAADNAGDSEGNGDATESEENSSDENVLNFTNGDQIPTMDSSMATDEYAFQFLGATMEGLYRLGEDGEPVEGIAEDHEESEDGLTWTFDLRDDAEWSNGEPVTAHDFVYAWQRAVDPDTGSEYGPYMMEGVIKNASEVSSGDKDVDELGVKAEDDHTLVVELEAPVAYFESFTTFGTFLPMNEEIVEEQGDSYAQDSDSLLYNGPFVMDDWESTSDSWNLVKNEDYWDADTVELEKMTYEVVKDPQTAVDLYESGKVDRAGLSSDLVDAYSTHDDYETVPQTSVFHIKMNQTRNEALENTNIRAAIARAFDKQAMVDEILNNGSTVSNGLIPKEFVHMPDSGEDFRDVNGDMIEYNVDEAKEYWEKGLEELGTDSIELEFLAGDSETAKTSNEYLVNQLESNLEGLDLTLKQVPFEQLIDLQTDMDYDLLLTGWGPDYLDPYTFLSLWITDGGNNEMGYSNEEYDKLLEETMQGDIANDNEARYENFLEAEKILFEDAAIAPVYQKSLALLISPKVEGVFVNPFGPTYEYKWSSVGSEE